jgi:predicted TIM-barrel fold metal-dependent hydrolase
MPAPRAAPRPIIDMHLHAYTAWEPDATDRLWIPDLPMPETDDELMRRSLEIARRSGIIAAATSGEPEKVARWHEADPQLVIPSLQLDVPPRPGKELDALRRRLESGEIRVIGEVLAAYDGIGPDDPSYEPLFALAEELDVPIGIHMGPGPKGVVRRGSPAFRASACDPLLLEEPLRRHPGLRVYLMHAGWPMLDHTLALLWEHPDVYVDIGVIDWYVPRPSFHRYLRGLIEAGFEDRIMFGSDQMNWPDAIPLAIDGVDSADFLTDAQRSAIFHGNAARFLRLS